MALPNLDERARRDGLASGDRQQDFHSYASYINQNCGNAYFNPFVAFSRDNGRHDASSRCQR